VVAALHVTNENGPRFGGARADLDGAARCGV
jgi:hypothetical protein